MSFKFLELIGRSTQATSKFQRRRKRLTRFLIEQLEERRVFANLTAMDAWLVDSQSSERLAAPVIGELLVPMAYWTVSGASGTLNYDVEYNIDGISVYRGSTNFGNGGWLWYRGASYATAGTHTLRITIDPFNTVVETNESDNSFLMQFTTANVSTLPSKFEWPLAGVQGKDWTIINYVDVDPRPSTRADYLGGTFQYDGHDAIDITLANFKAMDAGVPILAAASGTVTEVGDGNYDRNQTWDGQPWNYVRVDHGNGWATVYGHAMQNSIAVKVGDVVAVGDILGYVGSSGNSTAAHLHFAVLHGSWQVETNIAPSQYWKNPLPYMGAVPGNVLSSDITNYDAFSSPTVDFSEGISEQPVISSTGSQTVRFVFSISHFLVGESWVGKVYSPTNVLLSTSGPFGGWTEPVRGGARWFSATRTWTAGRYRAVVEVNGVERQSEFFDVAAVVPPQLRVDLNNAIVLDGRTTPINLGSVALNGVSPSANFQLWNHGGSALSISSITASGGFTVPNAPITLQPGERRTVQVNMSTSTVGKQFGEIRIASNDPDSSLYSFNVSGTVTGTATPAAVTLSTSATPYSVANIPYLLDRNISISSPSSTFGNAILAADFRSGADAADRLIIIPQGDGAGQVNLAGNTVRYAGVNVGSYTGGSNGTQLSITFNTSASLATVNAVAKRIAFQTSRLTTAPRYVAYTMQEQGASASAIALKMIVQGQQSVAAPSFVVTNANDSGPGSLRQAIIDANSNTGNDLIQFVLPSNQRTINPTSALPTITDPVTIDATTQPGYVGNPIVELVGSAAGSTDGLRISAGSSTVRGLVIRNFANSGIVLTAGDNNVIEGNYIGTNLAGTAAAANGRGIRIEAGSAGNLIGTDGNGTNDSSERNLISGNTGNGIEITGAGSNNNVVAGNLVGVNLAASAALANANGIAVLSGAVGNRIGTNGDGIGDTAERNVLSGNRNDGVQVQGIGVSNTIIAGNFVGTSAAGNSAIPNAASGIAVFNSAVGTRIGTDKSNDVFNENERNIVSGNSGAGIFVAWAGTDNTKIVGNSIGTDFAGNAKVANNDNGIYLETATNTLIDSNVVSGNNVYGIYVRGAANTGGVGGTGTVLTGNFIGTNRSGNGQLGNTWSGLAIDAGSKGTRVGSNNDGINDEAERNLISGNSQAGVIISTTGADDTIVRGNYIGTDITGELDFGNGGAGVVAVGAPKRAVIEGNVISGNNSWGVQISDGANELHRVSGNKIGTNASGMLAVGNGAGGVYIGGGAKNNFVGTNGDGINDANERNQIAGNLGNGIQIDDSISSGNVVAGNWIGLNAAGAGALPNAEGVVSNQAVGTRIGTNGDGVSDDLERNVISGNTYTGIWIIGGVEPIRGLTQVDQMIAGTLTSRTVTATINQADLVDQTNPAVGNWPQNNPTPGGGGDDYAFVATGTLQVTTAGIFSFAMAGDNGGRLKINGTTVISDNTLRGFTPEYGQISLPVGTHSFEWIGFEAWGAGGWELSVAVGAGNTSAVSTANGWKVIGDASPHPQVSLNGTINVTAYYSTQLIQTATVVAGNYIGTNAAGSAAVPNNGDAGISVGNSAVNTRIGTDGNGVSDLFERNVISGNAQEGIQHYSSVGTSIAGNYIGLDASGTSAIGNAFSGIYLTANAKSVRIGTNGDGSGDAAERNVFSGNGSSGISIDSPETGIVVAGNYIGTNAAGTAVVGNTHAGVWASGTNGLVVGTNGNGIGDAGEGNLISGNGWDGIRFAGTSTNGVVAGNLVGTNASGLNPIPNALAGVAVYAGNTNIRIGTNADGISDANERNIISGNAREGVWIAGATTDGVVVAGNYIGVNIDGALALGNGLVGVNINFGAKNTRVGANGDGVRDAVERNIISANGNDGVLVRDAGTNGTVIAGNYVGTDVSGTIDLGNIFSGVAVWGGPANTRIGTDNSADAFNDSERNVISGNNSYGTYTADAATMNSLIAGNYIGVNAAGNAKLQNDGDGIYVYASVNTKIRTNVVSGNKGIGMYIRGALYAGGVGGTGTEISGNMIGTNASGTAIIGNASRGIQIDAGSKGTLVGSNGDGINDAQERNLISGNGGEGVAIGTRETDDTIVRGNYIGTDVTGELDFGNTNSGVVLWEWYYSPTSEGSPKRALVQDNVISGNSGAGIEVSGAGSDSHRISGNKIGTNKTGTIAVANGGSGIQISGGAKGNTIGTNGDGVKDSEEGNVISGNGGRGIRVTGAGTNDNVIAGNLIGLNALGSAAFSSTNFGVQIDGGALRTRVGTDGNGVSDVAERNIISGNATYGVLISGTGTNDSILAGNYIGTDMTGSSRIANSYAGVAVQSGALNTRIGTDGNNNGFDTNERNVISGNNSINVYLAFGAAGTVVSGNYVGLNAAGTASIENGFAGVYLWNGVDNTRIGTDGNGLADDLERNVISGNSGDGITINNSSYTVATTTNNVVAGNYIGLNSAGTSAVPNAGNGIAVYLGASNTRIGTDGSNDAFNANERNVISGNGGSGISVTDSITTGTVIAGNWVGVNASGDAAIPNSGNGVSLLRTAGARIGTNADGIADAIERNVVSGNLNSGIQVQGGVQEVFGLVQVDQMIAATIPSRISTGTIAQADLSDSTSPSNGNWSFNRPIPGGGGDDYAFVATGTLQVNTAGTYSLAMAGNEGGRLKVNGTTIITDDQLQGFSSAYASITLPVGSHTFEWTGFERNGSAGWELSVAVGAGNTSTVSSANGWKVLGDPTPHAQISLNGSLNVTVYYSTQVIDTATAIAGNFVGTNASGSSAIPNLGNAGILVGNLARNTRIGTNADGLADATERNTISGNAQEGIQIEGSANNTIVAGNYVGSDATGALSLGNGSSGIYSGILVWGNATNTRIGGTNAVEGNFLAYNTGSGLWVPDAVPANSSLVRNNSFKQNARVGVDLGAAGATPNDSGDIDGVRNAPVITYSRIQGSSLIIEGFARPGAMFDLYDTANYANGLGQGQRLLATFLEGSSDDLDNSAGNYGPLLDGVNVGTDTTNRFRFAMPLSSLPSGVSVGTFVTAIAIGPTSEFSNYKQLSPNDAPTDIVLANSSVVENAPVDTAVGALSVVDPNSADTFTYAFVSGQGSEHNANFRIDANGVVRTLASLDFESQTLHSIRIRATDQGGLYVEKAMSITIVNVAELTQPVQIGEGSSQRSIIRQLVLNFDNAISAEPGAFIVQQRRTDAGVVSFLDVATQAVLTSTAAGGTKVTLTFSGNLTNGFGALADGNYQLTVVGTKVKSIDSQIAFDGDGDGVAGGNLVYGAQLADQFFALFGDTNGDGVVGVAEFGLFRSAFGKTSSQAGYDALFDYEGDGIIGVSDFGQFRARFGKSRMPF